MELPCIIAPSPYLKGGKCDANVHERVWTAARRMQLVRHPGGDPVASGASAGLRLGAGLRRVATEASSCPGGGSGRECKQDEGSTTRCSRKQEALTGVLPPGLNPSSRSHGTTAILTVGFTSIRCKLTRERQPWRLQSL